jgi:N-methylhydantoinase A/oxoprolinase/acetone carboxylase beta subunit
MADRPVPLVARALRFEVPGRLGADGRELEAVDVNGVPEMPSEVSAVAVCLLHADLNASHERIVAGVLRQRGLDVSASHEVSPEFREYERTVTTVLNAYLRPVCSSYLGRLTELAGDVLVATSAGGLVPVAAALPVALLLSGPAAGVRAGAVAAMEAGYGDAVTFDMGGTSTDVCLVRDGRPEPAAQRMVAGLPVRLPALAVHTIGAGGGSIAVVDSGGALQVGPVSAGAFPGPAAYGLGGTQATVTDADVVAGRIPAGTVLPGIGPIDIAAAQRAVDALGPAVGADGILAVVDAAMTQAVRRVTVERGVDPRDLALVAFGGAGPLHACAVAEQLGMAAVIVPPRAGVLSAVGLLGSPRQVDLVRSWPDPGDHAGVSGALDEMSVEAEASLGSSFEAGAAVATAVVTAVDCRYAGQSHELTVASLDAFPAEHLRRNGYARPGWPIEVVALRVRATSTPAVDLTSLSELAAGGPRRPVVGPAVVAEGDCTVWVAPGWRSTVTSGGSWVLTHG